jgi:serine O-acetyltransferase
MIKYFKSIKERDPAARHFLQIILTYPGVQAMFFFRIAHFFYIIKLKLIGELIMHITKIFTHIDIHPAAKIGKRLFIDHGLGVVIGASSIIGDDCTIYQGSTLGGRGENRGKRHPTLGNNVLVGAGAKVLGNIVIGDNAKIGSNAVVLHDIEPGKTIVGPKGKVIN